MRIHFIQHVHFETPGFLLEWAQTQNHAIGFTNMYEDPVFPAVQDLDWLIVMGGPMGVYEEDRYPWLLPEKAFIKAVIAAGKKVLGVCLGAQLLAEVLGAKVYPNKEKEIGWWPVQTVQHEQAASITAGIPELFTAFHWHGDTFDLPAGAVHLFETRVCPHQGYLFNNQVAGLQFHLEATPPLINLMLQYGQAELITAPYIQTEAQIKSTAAQYLTGTRQYMTTFINNFLKL